MSVYYIINGCNFQCLKCLFHTSNSLRICVGFCTAYLQCMVLILESTRGHIAHVWRKSGIFEEKKIIFATAVDLNKCLKQIKLLFFPRAHRCVSYHFNFNTMGTAGHWRGICGETPGNTGNAFFAGKLILAYFRRRARAFFVCRFFPALL